MIASFGLLAVSMKTLPLGTAYTIWTGIGAVGAFLLGIVVLGEAATRCGCSPPRSSWRNRADEAFQRPLSRNAVASHRMPNPTEIRYITAHDRYPAT